MVILYFTGILVGILMALLMRGTLFKGEAVPFVMELPNYRMPGAKNVAQLLWEKAKDFSTARLHGHFCCDDHHLVPANV